MASFTFRLPSTTQVVPPVQAPVQGQVDHVKIALSRVCEQFRDRTEK